MVGANDVDRAVGQARHDRVAISCAAQRRIETKIRVEVPDVDIDQVHMMDAHVGRHRQAFALGLPHQSDPFARRQATDMNLRAGCTLQFEDRMQCDGLGNHRYRRQSEPTRHCAGAGDALAGQRVFNRTQPHRQLERLRIAHCLQQHRVIVRQAARLHERDTSGSRERLQFCQRFSL